MDMHLIFDHGAGSPEHPESAPPVIIDDSTMTASATAGMRVDHIYHYLFLM